MKHVRRVTWVFILIVDAAFVAWGAAAALAPDRLPGPSGQGILPAGYEGYSALSWSRLVETSPLTAGYVTLLFRMYGIYCALIGVAGCAIAVTAFRRGEPWAWWTLLVTNTVALLSAMTYDKTVNAIGPFEITEYLGLAIVWIALAVTAPFHGTAGSSDRGSQPHRRTYGHV